MTALKFGSRVDIFTPVDLEGGDPTTITAQGVLLPGRVVSLATLAVPPSWSAATMQGLEVRYTIDTTVYTREHWALWLRLVYGTQILIVRAADIYID